jgi:hypothetical protein
MTTNVPKGANRAAAAQRTNRHAQRTPLPPRPGKVADAIEVIAAGKAASSNGERPDDRSVEKAKAFAEKAAGLGWEPLKAVTAGAAEITVTRGSETIVQAWRGGVWQYDASVYAYGDRTTKPRNASGAAKLLERSADDAGAEMAKVAANRQFRKAEPKDLNRTMESARKHLPFDPQLATDEEVLTVLSGQSIVWYNRISRNTESAIVGRSKSLRMTLNEDGERVVLWCCPVTGFRACLVTAILKVGRGRLESSKAETQKVLVDA